MSLCLLRGLGVPRVHAWVYFIDKDPGSPAERSLSIERARSALPARTLWRRSKTLSPAGRPLVDELDLPVSGRYLGQVLATGARRRAVSRWLNAVSVEADAATLQAVAALPCVARLDLVAAFRRDEPIIPEAALAPGVTTGPSSAPSSAGLGRRSGASRAAVIDSTLYGHSWGQLNQIQVPQLHALGLRGEGILICMLDDGFKLTHEAFNYPGHPIQVAHSRDFINGDTIVVNEAGQDSLGQDAHGTWTTSILAGYFPGRYLGAAYNARFLLGKTEIYPAELPVEEDYWCMGVEWADSLGADLVSSSLGYNDWYTYPDFDGHTAVTTRCASIAAARGLMIVNAMGNEGAALYPQDKMIAPADGDSVLSVGAVDSSGFRAPYSSRGPTYDGRIKPDIMTRGTGTWVLQYSDSFNYNAGNSGTSFATPLAAGGVALILEKHPEYTPLDVMHVVRQTGDRFSDPDTLYGWGVMRAYDAAFAPLSAVDSGGQGGGPVPLALFLAQNHPNPFRGGTVIDFAVAGSLGPQATVKLQVVDVEGRVVVTLQNGSASVGAHQVIWNGRSSSGAALASGIYFLRLQALDEVVVRRMVLFR